MRKIFTSIFALLGISLLFISCELMADIWAEILSPIDKIYLYTLDDNGNETTSASIYEDGWIDLNYEIMYSSDSTSSCEVELFSDDESVATVAWQSDTVYDEGKVRVYGISAGDCVITMKSTKYKNESASVNVHGKARRNWHHGVPLGSTLSSASISLFCVPQIEVLHVRLPDGNACNQMRK